MSFHHKRVGQRAAVVAAGPIANFLLAIVILAGLFMTVGQAYTPPQVSGVVPDSAAAAAGFRPGDVIVAVDGQPVERFQDVQQAVMQRPGDTLVFVVERGGERVTLEAVPTETVRPGPFGRGEQRIGLLGLEGERVEFRELGPFQAVWEAVRETGRIVVATLAAIGEMIAGERGTEELGGPLRIAQMSGDVASAGFGPWLWFIAVLSINLGLINLLPVPLLDGGHLLFYGIEAVRGRPLGERAQEYGFRVGLALVLTLMVFATWNDLVQLQVVDFFKGLAS